MATRGNRRPAKRANTPPLPPLPATVHTALGPVPVECVVGSPCADDTHALGEWDGHQRIIRLRADVPDTVRWQALWHERVHAILWDAGIRLPARSEEAVADAIGSALVAEMVDAARGKRRR